MKRIHEMPFGAQVLEDGRTRFRLWAPTAKSVELLIGDEADTRTEKLTSLDQGWYEATAKAPAGTRYRYRIDGELEVPDPVSRYNPEDVHGASVVVDPRSYEWKDDRWSGRPWSEAVVYELHVGAFSPDGTFAGVERKLDHLVELGVTAIELLPLADFPGKRNWGYDGVLQFAPDASYGTPDDLKRLIDAAHARGVSVMLDVVYNHFGPEGNYLHVYAKKFFTERHHTDWGAAINFDGEHARPVRDFFIHNALYWLEEFHFDGLRFDAVHAIVDDSKTHILNELAQTVRERLGQKRSIHLVLENDKNQSRFLQYAGGQPKDYDAQWNDDFHHACHVLVTGERDGYYGDYADKPAAHVGRCLAEGFAYQGDPSPYREGEPRGEPSRGLPPLAFVNFLQNHDQVGNRAMGERMLALSSREKLRPMTAAWLLSPQPPMLYMGEEFGAATPFLFFCDFGPELAKAVTEGRRREFGRFANFSSEEAKALIPDPNARETFERSKLDWTSLDEKEHAEWLDFYRNLLRVRRERIAPCLTGDAQTSSSYHALSNEALTAEWTLPNGNRLTLLLNLSGTPQTLKNAPGGECLLVEPASAADALGRGEIVAFTAAIFLETPK